MKDNQDDGPMPWSHWAAAAGFPENLPGGLRDVLFSEPDAWTARNSKGKTALDLHAGMLETHASRHRQAGFDCLSAWMGSRQLARAVADPTPSSRAPPARRF